MVVSNDAATEFRLLGPVEVVREGQPLRLGGRRQRELRAYSDRGSQLAARQVISAQARWSIAR
jgi:hypothetical protein